LRQVAAAGESLAQHWPQPQDEDDNPPDQPGDPRATIPDIGEPAEPD
jgi:hypothetical protein